MDRIYACIDLKSFYASVECVERNLNPLTTNLVVADKERTEKTICLAVTPSLKQYGLSGRSRLFEVVQKVKEINNERKKGINYKNFIYKSYNDEILKKNKYVELDYITATPRMAHYIEYSSKIYDIYLKYLAPEDIYVYSIDEVFCDITDYLKYYKMTPKELISNMIKDVYETTGITATGGIGSNMYLAKVAMDIVAKHIKPNEIGVRIAELDVMNYRKLLWNHKPLTSFWRIGPGISKKLEQYNIQTMGDIARCSINNEDLLYKLFGVNAELLIDHAWGYEPVTMKDIKNYKPLSNSISTGQVLHCAYNYEKTRLVVREMIDSLSLDLVDKNLVTDQLVLNLIYDVQNITNININYDGDVTIDQYGRIIPKHSHGTINIGFKTSSSVVLSEKCIELYDKIVNKKLLIKKVNIAALNLKNENEVKNNTTYDQLDIFSKVEDSYKREFQKSSVVKENILQKTVIDLKKKYGKNSILKGIDLEDGATAIDRNRQIGGHHE